MRHAVTVFDAADLAAGSSFWSGLLGGVVEAEGDWHMVMVGSEPRMAPCATTRTPGGAPQRAPAPRGGRRCSPPPAAEVSPAVARDGPAPVPPRRPVLHRRPQVDPPLHASDRGVQRGDVRQDRHVRGQACGVPHVQRPRQAVVDALPDLPAQQPSGVHGCHPPPGRTRRTTSPHARHRESDDDPDLEGPPSVQRSGPVKEVSMSWEVRRREAANGHRRVTLRGGSSPGRPCPSSTGQRVLCCRTRCAAPQIPRTNSPLAEG